MLSYENSARCKHFKAINNHNVNIKSDKFQFKFTYSFFTFRPYLLINDYLLKFPQVQYDEISPAIGSPDQKYFAPLFKSKTLHKCVRKQCALLVVKKNSDFNLLVIYNVSDKPF